MLVTACSILIDPKGDFTRSRDFPCGIREARFLPFTTKIPNNNYFSGRSLIGETFIVRRNSSALGLLHFLS